MLAMTRPASLGREGRLRPGDGFQTDRDDLYKEIEETDTSCPDGVRFPAPMEGTETQLLWETRFSISERRNQFDKALR